LASAILNPIDSISVLLLVFRLYFFWNKGPRRRKPTNCIVYCKSIPAGPFISLNWKGKPLVNFETVVNLIGGTRTRGGLKVKAVLDTNRYDTGVEVFKEDIKQLQLKRHKTHPDWTYTLLPRT
jgi:Rhodopirellula transposase DDE domain